MLLSMNSEIAAISQETKALELAQLLKASGDSLRLDILRILSRDSFGVLELSDIFQIKQSGMSHHLKVLSKVGLVSTRREGNSIFYRRSPLAHDDQFWQLKSALFEEVDRLPIADTVTTKIQSAHGYRAEKSQQFFSENANRLRTQQDLIAEFDVYAEHVKNLINGINLPERQHCLEIGPGAGEFLDFLSKTFEHVTALDNNAEVLQQAKQNNSASINIEFIHQDTRFCRDRALTFDCIVANMVLHHTPSPDQIFEDASCALKNGGSFIVCDLTQHDQDWTRDACGDLWLGFTAEDLSQWAKQNAFREGQSDYFALRNGFQIQIRQFIKN